jgi:hypothetical protein
MKARSASSNVRRTGVCVMSICSFGICRPVATVESKLPVVARTFCRSVVTVHELFRRQRRFHEMSVVSDLRVEVRVSSLKLTPPSCGSVSTPLVNAPIAS